MMKFNDEEQLAEKEKSAIESIGRFYSLGMELYDSFHELCGSLDFYTSGAALMPQLKLKIMFIVQKII